MVRGAVAAGLVVVACAVVLGEVSAKSVPEGAGEERYVVVLDGSADPAKVVAERHSRSFGARVERVLAKRVKGYAARLSKAEAKAIARQPGVVAVGLDPVGEPAAQSLPLGARRVFAADADCQPANNAAVNQNLDVDCIDDVRVDVDVAVLDTPVDPSLPDLNVVSNVDCFGDDPQTGCVPGVGSTGSQDCLENHGAAVANTIAGIDNGIGIVGVAPGARIWSVAVGDKDIRVPSHCSPSQPFYMSDVLAGVEWVTAHSDDIEVANMSLRFPLQTTQAGLALDAALEGAIDDSIDAGVVYVVAAGNEAAPASESIPAKYDRVITATAVMDTDGLPNGAGDDGQTCTWGPTPPPTDDEDDTNSDASNYGDAADPDLLDDPGVDIAAPNQCTSIAAAHTSGAAAILASTDNPDNATDVQTIRNTLLTTGNTDTKANGGWDDETNTTRERLLDVSNETAFNPATVAGSANPNPDSDVDGDGKSDLVTLRATGTGYVYGGQISNTFSSGIASFGSFNSALFDGSGSYAIDIADVTGDSRGDLVTLSDSGDANVYGGQANRTFAAGVSSALGLSPALLAWGGFEPIAVADVNGNGRSDLIVYDDQTRDTLVFPGQANGTFGAGIVAEDNMYSALHTGAGEYFVDVADVTGDGRGDLVTMTTWDDVWVRPGQSDGTFGDPAGSYWNGVVIQTSLHDANGHEPVGVDDVNGDGRADLVTSQGGSIHVYRGLASGYFSTAVSSFNGALPSGLFNGIDAEIAAVMDVNGDGHADLVVSEDGDEVRVYLGRISGTFEYSTSSLSGFRSTRHSKHMDASGREIVIEKPSLRRRGCLVGGCD